MKKLIRILAVLCFPALAFADTEGDMRRQFSISQGVNASGIRVPNFTAGYQIAGSNVSGTEAGYVDGVTAGTITASKALVVDASKLLDSGKVSRKMNSLTADSSNFGGAGANVEAVFSNGSYTIPASLLAAGDTMPFEAYVAIPTTVGADTLRLRVRIGGLAGTVVFDSTAIDVANANFLKVRGSIDWRTVGAAGTALSTVDGNILMGATDDSFDPVITALSSQVTTSTIALVVTAVWSTENANVAVLKQFNVYHN